jgi:hypothetical protein
MDYQITPSEDRLYIVITVQGEINRQIAMHINQKAHEMGKETGVNRYLMDLRESRNSDSVVDQYEFAYRDMQSTVEIDRYARVALLVAPEDHSHDFIVTVCVNSGLNVALFTDMQQAIHFLKA